MTEAAPNTFPLPDHRSMEVVLIDEAKCCFFELVEINGDAGDCQFRAENPEAWA